MTEPTFDYVDAIVEQSAGFAAAAGRDLTAPVPSCPGWAVADLVRHLTEVHWMWATIVEERLAAEPDESRLPTPASDADAIAAFTAGADRLASTLREATQTDRVWTWSPSNQTVGFITRHQVQEAAVHHWDAANATGTEITIATAIAVDAIEEFLTYSVASADWPAPPSRELLSGTFGLQCTDSEVGWTVRDGDVPRTVGFSRGVADVPTITAPSADLLLWLFGRVSLNLGEVDPQLAARFRQLCSTD